MTSREYNEVITEEYILRRAAVVVARKSRHSIIANAEAENALPQFQLGEIKIGKILGVGGYCTVCEVKQITLATNDSTGTKDTTADAGVRDEHDDDYVEPNLGAEEEGGGTQNVIQDRNYMATRYLRHGKDARYAVKTLSCDTVRIPERFLAGVVDLAIEAKFLSCLRHPNIIKMRAMSSISPFEPGFFIVLDRLYDTLSQRLKMWKKQNSIFNCFAKASKKDNLLDRFYVCLDLSSALAYLHEHNVVYRDLKPDNIGFDVRGDVKLFDFGLSVEITDKHPRTENGLFKLSGNTGSLRYMAPEVALEKAYNHKVDVYSYGILLWQILSLRTPFEGTMAEVHREKVILGNTRLPLNDPVFTTNMKTLVTDCWSADIDSRPEFIDASFLLRKEIGIIRGESTSRGLDVSNHTEKSL